MRTWFIDSMINSKLQGQSQESRQRFTMELPAVAESSLKHLAHVFGQTQPLQPATGASASAAQTLVEQLCDGTLMGEHSRLYRTVQLAERCEEAEARASELEASTRLTIEMMERCMAAEARVAALQEEVKELRLRKSLFGVAE